MTVASFKARSRILSLLGDQLIGRDYLAVFELVKNAFDADASEASVSLEGIDDSDPIITVRDDGEGMDEDTIVNHWLEIGNNHREIQRAHNKRTKTFNRLPLGEKGLGRIACHKLGRCIELTTRKVGSPEKLVRIQWDDLLKKEYLDQTEVEIQTNDPPIVFPDGSHGTLIEVSDLRRKEWSRREVRSLYRAITSICSPFEGAGDFVATLNVPERDYWLEGMLSVEDMIQSAPWKFKFKLAGDRFEWTYEFAPPTRWGKQVEGRKASNEPNDGLLLAHEPRAKRVVHDASMLEGIGPITGEFYAYDRDNKILKEYPQVQALKQFLQEQSGIRVYRDGVRVFNYGEPGDDWLSLDLRRVNRPTEKLSRNIVVGGVHVTLEGSSFNEDGKGLREKSNREGFDENEVFETFRKLVLAIIDKFEVERAPDKRRLKQAIEGAREKFERPVEKPVADLRARIEKTEYSKELLPLLDKVEADYQSMKELLLRAGMSGVNLAIVVHEVHRGIVSLYEAIRRRVDPEELTRQAHQLVQIFETIAGLLRQKGTKEADIREVVQTAVESISRRRFQRHHVHVEFSLPELDPPFIVSGSFDLLLGALTNLIDNSLYWLRVRYPESDPETDPVRKLYVGISEDLEGGRALIVADNGPGFSVDPEMLAEPFVTRRPGGSGLGLYYASLACQLCGGTLSFPDPTDLTLPDWVDGAVIGMVFPEQKQ